MKNFKTYGNLVFDPINHTNKHEKQSSWKKHAIIIIDDESCEYYQWFLKKRFNLHLLPPLRKSHVTLINDKYDNQELWDLVKEKYNNKIIDLYLDVDVQSNGKHWFLNVPNEHTEELDNIRKELNLGSPFFHYHFTIGFPNERNLEFSQYISSFL
jgi:hypothetical protein